MSRIARVLALGPLSDLLVVLLGVLTLAGPVAGGLALTVAGTTLEGPPTSVAAALWLTLMAYRAAWRRWQARWPRQVMTTVLRYRVAISLAAIFLAALWLRLWGIEFGLPLIVHPDEPSAAGIALDMLRRGSLDPAWYIYPTFYMYLLLPAYGLYYVYGRGRGLFDSLPGVDRAEGGFYLIGRYYSAVIGAATTLLTFGLARALWGRARGTRVGLGAAILVATSFVHVRESHFAVTDVTTAALTTGALIAIAGVLNQGRTRDYVLAGLITGLAGSTKYTALPIVFSFAVAHLLGRPPGRWLSWRAALGGAALPVGFIAGSPFTVLNWPPFLEHLGWLNGYSGAPDVAHVRQSFWSILGYMGESGFGAFGFWAIAAAVAVALLRRRPPELLLALTLIGFFPQWTHTTHPFYARFLLPIVPVAALLMVSLFDEIADWLSRRPVAGARVSPSLAVAVLVVLAAWSPMQESLWFGAYYSREDSRTAAYHEIVRAAPDGAIVASEVDFFRLPPEYNVLEWRPLHSRGVPGFVAAGVQYVVLDERRDGSAGPLPRGLEIRDRIRRRFEEIARFAGDPGPPIVVYRVPAELSELPEEEVNAAPESPQEK